MKEEAIEFDNNLIEEFESTTEYKAWQDTLFAIIGYTSDVENEDENLSRALIADHLDASFGLQKGIEKAKNIAKYKKMKQLNDEFVEENRGE
ncbi:MAG TPA: hypothetical protein VMC48_01685 [Methanobacterium sp.]|nr:hypothetical protein [Methanobacterium sp.]